MLKTTPCPVDVLAFGPHPDDIEIGAGGTLLQMVSQGYTVGLVDLTAGEIGTKGTPEQRQQEGLAAAKLLAAQFRAVLGLPDGNVCDDESSRVSVLEIIRAACPKVVMTTHPGDRHPDHHAAAKLVQSALFLARLPKYQPSATPTGFHACQHLWNYVIHDQVRPSFLVDISSVWEKKIEILRAFTTQMEYSTTPAGYQYIGTDNYLKGCDAVSAYWGLQARVARAEAFTTNTLPVLENPLQALNIK